LFKIKPPARGAYALEGHARKITKGICIIFRGLFFEHNPREIGSAFHPDGIRTSKAFHWEGRASTEIVGKRRSSSDG
jgi:hypothetical protein